MTSCRDVRDQLSLFSDGLLRPEEHAAIRAHVRQCPDCGGVLADLERIVTTARQLGPVTPPEHVWLQVAGSVRLTGAHTDAVAARPVPTRSPVWQWIGLAASLVLITFAIWLFQAPTQGPPDSAATSASGESNAAAGTEPAAAPAASLEAVNDQLDLALGHYAKAIAELEAIATSGDDAMDAQVATAVKGNLTAVDVAIAESRAALTTNPESEPARDSLFEALRRKVTVLQAAASLINEMRQGDSEGAARAAEELRKES
jgi:hypothetical protein